LLKCIEFRKKVKQTKFPLNTKVYIACSVFNSSEFNVPVAWTIITTGQRDRDDIAITVQFCFHHLPILCTTYPGHDHAASDRDQPKKGQEPP
jgi:hypothetical protein